MPGKKPVFITYRQNAFKDFRHIIQGFSNDRWQYADFSLDIPPERSDPWKVFMFGGPYGLLLRISDPYIEFLAPIYNRHDWYSSDNSRDVAEWRSYFRQITAILGSESILYITTAYFEKYHDFFRDMESGFTQKLETLKPKHGILMTKRKTRSFRSKFSLLSVFVCEVDFSTLWVEKRLNFLGCVR
jgi:hypothetical protein